jgi:hypothetical protein
MTGRKGPSDMKDETVASSKVEALSGYAMIATGRESSAVGD